MANYLDNFFDLSDEAYKVRTKVPAREGALPFTEEMLKNLPSGDLFGWSHNVGMGWRSDLITSDQVLILTTAGGIRAEDGQPIALGYHTGHWEVSLIAREAAEEFKSNGWVPFAGHCSDPCDGRTQGTKGMMDSLAYRNSAAEVLGRLTRSLPTAKGVMGIATCDKGLPAMMMALSESKKIPGILVPGGVTLPPDRGEDTGTVQSIGSRFSHGEISLKEAAEAGCAACASAGGGCQFFGTAATSQAVAEGLGIALPHSALAPSGEKVWLEIGRASSQALMKMIKENVALDQIITDGAVRNAMAVHAAMGGSTNLLIHLPAIAYAAGLKIPEVDDWAQMNRSVPRIVDVLPNGPNNYMTVQVFLAGGVTEVMLHLRELELIDLNCLTVSGNSVGKNLEIWEGSERRNRFRDILYQKDGVDPDDVIMSPERASEKGLARTLAFLTGNLAPDGAVVKSTSISPDLFSDNGIYFHEGKARVFVDEGSAIAAVKSIGNDRVLPGEVIALLGRGPIGAGMPETTQITSALKYTSALSRNVLITDGRFSGFSSGPCIGHVGPEALAGGPLAKLRDGDSVRIEIHKDKCKGTVDYVGPEDDFHTRPIHPDLREDPDMPASVKLWAALQNTGGGIWGGCVPDTEEVINRLAPQILQKGSSTDE
ncbi:MAG TPA: YjhG/YagF family D-xylonate dehydratase [Verrucomicrobia bacterium]|nr:YjhG/YagF family D-xylonate dehydratase [Verrucomicrobiales bacterium]HIL54482.1 YjhG/YagF family D-xylonate dehydratase [Verrucomicrobiota bacterium]